MEEEEDIVLSVRGPSFCKKSSLKLSELLSEPFLLTEKNASYRFVFRPVSGGFGMLHRTLS